MNNFQAKRAELYAFATFLLVLVIDQISKEISKEAYSQSGPKQIIGPFELVSVANKGIAFGQLDGLGPAVLLLFVTVILAALIYYFVNHAAMPLLWLAVGMITGGAIGNVIDRIGQGAVHDFISVSFWPAFNLADVFVSIGAVILFFTVLRNSNKQEG